jgi:hypothetical protein
MVTPENINGTHNEKSAQASDTATTLVPPSSPIQETKPPDNVINIYDRGFANGVFRIEIEKDTFEAFLKASNDVDQINAQRKQNENSLEEAKNKLKTDSQTLEIAQETVIAKGKPIEHTQLEVERVEQRRTSYLDKQKALSIKQEETKPEHPWLPALFFFLAGVVFIVGDISITHQITSWGFDMAGMEGWIFAVGLAFTAFLIKPLIDRLLEKPFQKAGHELKRLYKAFLIGITVLGLLMLFFLGRFRSDAQTANTKLIEIRRQQSDISDVNSAEYRRLTDDRKKINEALTNNKVGEWGIILSGIVFAIGGGLCLAVAFPSLTQLTSRYWILPLRIRDCRVKAERCNKQLLDLRSNLAALSVDKAAQKMKTISLSETTLRIHALEEEQKSLLVKYYEAQYEKERTLYHDGRNRGEKYSIEGDLIYRVIETDFVGSNGSKAKNGNGSDSPRPYRTYTRRPFIKMRKMIADNYNKNQNNNSQDGTEFEIVS